MKMRNASALGLLLGACFTLAACDPARNGASPQSASAGLVSGPEIGRCHQGGCSWFDITDFTMVRETPEAALLRLTVREGGSEHANSAYPENSRGVAISWSDTASDYLAFCSRKFPAIIMGNDSDGWEAVRLDLTASSGPTEFITSIYRHVCHNDEAFATEGAAERLGYRPLGDGETTIPLSRPEDIFDRAG